MINKLLISNYAIINRLEIDFLKGLTIITGETGAGKSIILGALNLLLGNRFESVNFKEKSNKSIIEGVFDISHLDLTDFFISNNIDYDSNDNIVARGNAKVISNNEIVTSDLIIRPSGERFQVLSPICDFWESVRMLSFKHACASSHRDWNSHTSILLLLDCFLLMYMLEHRSP